MSLRKLPEPRGLRVMSKERPGALPLPARRDIHALTKPQVFDRWGEDSSGVRAVASGDNVITMFDVIGEDFWTGGGVTAKRVSAQLRAIGDRPVEVQLNSPGGDMFEGIAIFNVLREHPQDITIKVMGMAASAASVIAMAGDRIEIGAASFMMIHKAWVLAMGNEDELRETADWLQPFDQAMADLYAARTSNKVDDIQKWMKAETYMSGSQAIERGFADALLPADSVTIDAAAKASDTNFNKLRAAEIRMMMGGDSRASARARVNEIRGTTDSAPKAGTTDSAGDDWSGLAGLLATCKSRN
jgi:ATP-dependent Clp protease, protease subunit